MSTSLSTILENARNSAEVWVDGLYALIPHSWQQTMSVRLPEGADPRLLVPVIILTFIFFIWLLVRLMRRPLSSRNAYHLDDLTRAPRRFGIAITVALVFGLGTWAFQAPLAGAAIAPGVISPEGHRRTVQHLEGGIVSAIHVKEGDVVTAGQVLLTLEDVAARARLEEISSRYAHMLARAARLTAELHGSGQLDEIESDAIADPSELQAAMSNQRELFGRRIATRQGREDILQKRVRQLEEENGGMAQMIEGLDEKAQLIGQEIESVTELFKKGLERKPRMLALERAAVDIWIERASQEAQIARNNQKIGETELQLLTMRQQDVEKVSEELTEVRRAIAELSSEMPWRADIVYRTEIRAPVSGIVFDVRVTTLSGVVKGGEPILDIVPSHVPLIIDARVKPSDIDVIKIGMPARIILSAYQQRNMPQLLGTLRSISADRLVEDRTGDAYYLAKIEVPSEEIANLPDVEIIPGMSADIMILTGEATVADYIISPLIGSIRQSFRENHGS